jgi:tetratricopeptide (TPR) repeat protein
MATDTTAPRKLTCFVVMGFGNKPDYQTGRTLDLDVTYHKIIKPAVEAADLRCVRADEIVHSGMIDVPMYENLLRADVVVADLSTSNMNALYELGVRHALRPFTTIIIREKRIESFPFDLGHLAIRQYRHMGGYIRADDAQQFQGELTEAIKQVLANNPVNHDSPVYTFLNDLTPPQIRRLQQAAEQVAEQVAEHAGGPAQSQNAEETADRTQTRSELMSKAHDAEHRAEPDWPEVKRLLQEVRRQQKASRAAFREDAQKVRAFAGTPKDHEDPDILQRLALATYKSKEPTEKASLQEARDLLCDSFDIDTSNDTETLSLWGAIHKRRWNLDKHPAPGTELPGAPSTEDLNQAIRAYKRAYYLRNDHYTGINYAFLLNVRAAEATNPAEAIADFVQAQRVRKEVIRIGQKWLRSHPVPDPAENEAPNDPHHLMNYYWALATLGEAYAGLWPEEQEEATEALEEAYAMAPTERVKEESKNRWPAFVSYWPPTRCALYRRRRQRGTGQRQRAAGARPMNNQPVRSNPAAGRVGGWENYSAGSPTRTLNTSRNARRAAW